jgi:hypothetical protein
MLITIIQFRKNKRNSDMAGSFLCQVGTSFRERANMEETGFDRWYVCIGSKILMVISF